MKKRKKYFEKKKKKAFHLLESPIKIFFLALFLSYLNLSLRKTPLRLWNLYQEHDRILNSKKSIDEKSKQLELKIKRLSDPKFIEWEAKNRFDLAKKGELIFMFSKKMEKKQKETDFSRP